MSDTSVDQELRVIFEAIHPRIHEIEQQAYKRNVDPDVLLNLVAQLIPDLDKMPAVRVMQMDLPQTRAVATRLAAVYVQLILNFDIKLNHSHIHSLVKQKRFIVNVFEYSGYGSCDFLLRLLDNRVKQFKSKVGLDNPAIVRALAVSSIAEVEAAHLVDLSLQNSEMAALLTLGLLLDRMPAHAKAEACRQYLLEESTAFASLPAQDGYRMLVANVWMLCSYSASARKHDVKKQLNAWYRKVHQHHKLSPRPPGSIRMAGNTRNLPVMAIAVERFISIHAMYRWYAPLIKRLRQEYYLVLVSMAPDVDEGSQALFDEFIEVGHEQLNIQSVLDRCTPDVVYFPSVGMRSWVISLANLRWAPLQVMSHGHPATTHSEAMDAVFVNSRSWGGSHVYSENQLIIESEVADLIEAHRELKLPAPAELPDDVVRVAVPCNVMKINYSFLQALKDIESQATKPVRFMFFPNEVGLAHLVATRRIRNYFPNAVVARRTSYEDYLGLLNQNHMALSPFPFGNATTAIDCLVLGIPFIGLIGDEPHSRSDYDVLASFELEDYCIADSVESYIQGALSWINNPQMLQDIRALVASKNFMDIHHTGGDELTEEFADCMRWAFQNSDLLRQQHGLEYTASGRWKP